MADDASAQWGGVAASWEKDEARVGAAAGKRAEEWLLGHAGLRDGSRLLDVASGTGKAGLEAARRVLPGGTALLTDFAEPMVAAARRRAEAAGVAGVDFAVLDGQDLGPADDSFDVVMCGFGLMLMPDPVKAASEARRVLAPDGRFVLAVWAEAEANPWLGVAFRAVMDELGAPEPEAGMPGPFALGSAERLERVLRDAGFADVEVERVELLEPHESFDSWWTAVETSGGLLVTILQGMSDEARASVRRRAAEGAKRFENETGGLDFGAAFNGALAR